MSDSDVYEQERRERGREAEESLRRLYEPYQEEIVAHSDEEYYRDHYASMKTEILHMNEEVERVKHEADRDIKEADERAHMAEMRAREADDYVARL